MSEVDARLCLVLIQKLYELPAQDMDKVREYIKEIKEVAARLPNVEIPSGD